MTDIYEDHDKAFKHVAGYVVTDKNGERLATVAFKYAASGLRTTCYFHILGLPMVKAFASGGGYDKASAACHAAAQKVLNTPKPIGWLLEQCHQADELCTTIKDEGRGWDGDLRAAGFNVLQAV